MATRFGFLAKNNGGEVLIDSSAKNLFFLSKATYSKVSAFNPYAGGSRRLLYTISSPKTPLPFFSGLSGKYVAVTRITFVSGSNWEIELLVSGSATATDKPDVYVFIEYDDVLSPYGNWGMRVYNDTSGITFDSRLNPLIVKTTLTGVSPPSSPYTTPDTSPPAATFAQAMSSLSGNHGEFQGKLKAAPSYQVNGGDGLTDGTLTPDSTSTYTVPLTSPGIIKPIFLYSSIPQAAKQYHCYNNESYTVREWLWIPIPYPPFIIPIPNYKDVDVNFNSYYFVFCRAGIRATSTSTSLTVTAGWAAVNAAADYTRDDSETSGIAHFVGLSDSNYASSSVGTWPYQNQTINNRGDTVIVADGAMYD